MLMRATECRCNHSKCSVGQASGSPHVTVSEIGCQDGTRRTSCVGETALKNEMRLLNATSSKTVIKTLSIRAYKRPSNISSGKPRLRTSIKIPRAFHVILFFFEPACVLVHRFSELKQVVLKLVIGLRCNLCDLHSRS